MEQNIFFLIVGGFCLLLTEQFTAHAINPSSYGELCTEDDECTSERQFLSCVDGQCGCNPAKFLYQTFDKRATVDGLMELKVYSRDYKLPSGAGVHNESAYVNMELQIVYAESLLRSDVTYAFITSKVKQMVTETLSQCVGLSHQRCNPESNCVKNAFCKPVVSLISPDAATGICECREGFTPTSKGACGNRHSRPCSASNPCSDSFLCTNELCDCPQLTHQVYDYHKSKCVGLVLSFCSNDDDCQSGMICSVNSKTQKKQCRCATGFVENNSGKCNPDFGGMCTPQSQCDKNPDLKCRNGVCACPDTMLHFDERLRKCVGLVGSRCSISNLDSCVANGRCTQVEQHLKLSGQCLCSDGYTVNGEMQCTKLESAKNFGK